MSGRLEIVFGDIAPFLVNAIGTVASDSLEIRQTRTVFMPLHSST